MFENLASLKKVRVKALALTRFDNWIIIDSNQPTEAVALEPQNSLVKLKEMELGIIQSNAKVLSNE